MPRLFRRTSAVLLLLAAWAFVGKDHAPLWVTIGEASASSPGGEVARSSEKPVHDLTNMKIFTKVILYVKDNYVDPKRIKPKAMMIAALEYVEKTVPDVIVEGNEAAGKVSVTVGNQEQTFDISHVDSLWKMSFALKDIFRFISDNMRPMEDTRDVEYAAINGMLSKLDPHSVLLRPELYREMKLTTKGEFGGLGFVIQMKEGNLTVVKVLPKTPAYRAGIHKDDQIKKIGEESTINMDLNEAVSKLRGPVDSNVTITVERKGWDKPKAMTLSRAMITIESVQSKLLAQNVGYVRLKNFQGNTTRDLQAAIADLAKEAQAKPEPDGNLHGLILDLRGNPGGLLDQAIQVSDQFLSQGTIVATVGYSDKMREEKKARPDEGDNAYPVVVLVNAGSASASEIVAGALKNLNRAVIVGRQTFGKGSVQLLYDFPDESALKLTIAKYLTPGDVSIQEVGIVPDIDLIPTRVTRDRIDVFAPRKSMGEADLDAHFGNPSSQAVATKRQEVLDREKPAEQLKYLKEDPKQKDPSARAELGQEGKTLKSPKNDKAKHGEKDPLLDSDVGGTDQELDDQLDAETQDEIKEDFEVLFARDFLLKAPFVERDQMLQAGKAFIDHKRKEEADRINTAIGALGVDWSPGETPKNVQLSAQLKPGPEVRIEAGQMLDLEAQVENKGPEPIHRLRAWTESENPFLDRRELVFGLVKPGERKGWKVPIRLPKDFTSRKEEVSLRFFDDNGPLGETVVSELNFVELPRPAFAFGWQVIDTCPECNGDGLAQRGEQIDLVLDVTNVGKGKSFDSYAQIKNAADQNIFIDKGRYKLGPLLPGETKTARFQLEIRPGYRGDDFPLKLQIVDESLEEFAADKIKVPLVEKPPPVEPADKRAVRITDKVALHASPLPGSAPIAKLSHPITLAELGTAGGFYKVELEPDRFAFVAKNEAKETKAKPVLLGKEAIYLPSRVPPKIALATDTSEGGIVSTSDKFILSGQAEAASPLLDVYVLVNDQKVYFKSVTAEKDKPAKISFSTDFALKEGNNHVMVVAREDSDFASRKTLVIRRRSAPIAQTKIQPQPPPVQ